MQKTANPPRSSSPKAAIPPVTPTVAAPMTFAKAPVGPSRAVCLFRIVRWTTYGSALILLILLLHTAAPPLVSTSPSAAARAEEKVAYVQHEVEQGRAATLRMDETELNSYLASHFELAGKGAEKVAGGDGSDADGSGPSKADVERMRSNVRDMKVQLIGDRVRAYVVFDLHGKDMTLQLEGKLGTDRGFLRFEPTRGQLGALPIPQSTLNAAVKRMFGAPENRDKLKLPDEISDLRVENGEVVATYQ